MIIDKDEENDMKILNAGGWVFYVADDAKTELASDKVGKWMYFFDSKELVSEICKKAVELGVVKESKHNDVNNGVSCFYLNGDDIATHKKVIQYFLDNNLIRKTKKGRYYNMAFKYDNQTQAGEYGDDFQAEIKLEQFIDLDTGKWIV